MRYIFIFSAIVSLSTCRSVEDVSDAPQKRGGTYELIQTVKSGQPLVLSVPSGASDRGGTEVCYCRAKVTNATPPLGAFYVWAVGIYHSLPMFSCRYPMGPVGLLWNEGDEYVFTLCTNDPRIILEFAVSPPPNPAQWVPVSVTVRLECNEDGFAQSVEGVRYHTFSAEPGEETETRAYFQTRYRCTFGR